MREHFEHLLERLMRTRLRVLLITTRIEDLPRQVTHLLCVDQCRVVAAGPRAGIQCRDARGTAPGTSAARPERRLEPALDGQCSLGRARVEVRARPAKAGVPGTRAALKGGAAAAGGRELVRLRDITVRYGQSTILEGINWTVRAGESWALLGPNGSGKTTLLSLILGDNPQAYANEVVVFGRRRGSGESIWEIKRRIGSVSPELHLHFNEAMTCFEVVVSGFHETVGLFHRPAARQRALARRWLRRFGLMQFAGSPLFALSAGLQRMVLLARALVKGPQLLLLDEPCQGLDSAHRQVFVKAVNVLVRDGAVTAIYVTHREDEIPPSVRRVLRLGSFSEPAGLSGPEPPLKGFRAFADKPVVGALVRGTLQQSGIPGQRHRNRAAIGQINNQGVLGQPDCRRSAGCAINHQRHEQIWRVLAPVPSNLCRRLTWMVSERLVRKLGGKYYGLTVAR